jgi:hypothetical protein
MCKQHNPRKIDKCMKTLCASIAFWLPDYLHIVGCCCGHGKYPLTIVCHNDAKDINFLMTQEDDVSREIIIPRKKRFYVKDKQGYYYIPETVLPTKHNSD